MIPRLPKPPQPQQLRPQDHGQDQAQQHDAGEHAQRRGGQHDAAYGLGDGHGARGRHAGDGVDGGHLEGRGAEAEPVVQDLAVGAGDLVVA